MSTPARPAPRQPGQPLRAIRAIVPVALLGAALVAIEAGAVWILLATRGPGQILGFLAGHALVSLGAAGLVRFVPVRYRQAPAPPRLPGEPPPLAQPLSPRQRWLGYALFSGLVFAIPVFGLLGVLTALLPALHLPITERERDWRRIAIPPLVLPVAPDGTTTAPDTTATAATARPLIEILGDTSTPAEPRTAAVLALRHIPGRAAVPVLRVALADPIDDVRLLAYAMLARHDSGLQKRIQACEQRLARRNLPVVENLSLHHALAQLYWELVYTGLAAGAVAERVLGSAEEHCRAVLAGAGEGDAAGRAGSTSGPACLHGARFLFGKILLARAASGQASDDRSSGDALEAAKQAFLAARAAGFPDAAIRPYLAEIAYRRGEFAAVREHLAALSPGHARRPGLVSDLHRFWLGAARPAASRQESSP